MREVAWRASPSDRIGTIRQVSRLTPRNVKNGCVPARFRLLHFAGDHQYTRGFSIAPDCIGVLNSMSPTRPRLVLVQGATPLQGDQLQSLRGAFDVVEVDDLASARELLNGDPNAILACAAELAGAFSSDSDDTPTTRSALEHVAEGIGVVNADGQLVWSNHRLSRHSEQVRNRFIEHCSAALELFNRPEEISIPLEDRHSKEITFSVDDSYFELVVSPTSESGPAKAPVDAVVGALWENTASRQLQSKIDAIDAAGSELLRLDSEAITDLDMAERLRLLEDKIVQFVRNLLNFDNFEIRLIDHKTNRLELVIACGITPLKIGEVIYAEEEGNGISGYVAATGNSYICPDVARDPRYREGLDNAASSLTVPLRLHDKVIGVLNVESNTKNAFNENDLLFAELFGRYIAMAMNILDLLVVERYTTNAQISQNLVGELQGPLRDITEQAEQLRESMPGNQNIDDRVKRILETAQVLSRRITDCTSGPRTILETEQELHREQRDPTMEGKRILIADDEHAIRERLETMLQQRGCEVGVADTGLEAIEAVEEAARAGRPFDVVVSDIKMPDRNGYEVYRAATTAHPGTQVILMTGFGYDPHHSIVRSVQEGLHSFLFKPFKASQFFDELTKALHRAEGK